MKNHFAICAIAVSGLAAAANADDLLLIDLSTTNQITITATSGLSAASVSGPTFTGVYMDNFYNGAGAGLAATLVSGDLTTANNSSDSSPALFRGGFGSDSGLNLWSYSFDSTSSVTAGAVAFSGSATWTVDAAMFADMLNGNTSGDIYFPADTADDVSAATFIGTYRVVPAPGAASVLAIGLGIATRRRR